MRAMNNMIYTENLIVRMTEKEKKMLAAAAHRQGKNMSQLVRESVLNPPEVTRAEYENIAKMITYEVRKLGVNINQIAKKYNEYAYVEPSLELLSKLNQIVDIMYEIREKVGVDTFTPLGQK